MSGLPTMLKRFFGGCGCCMQRYASEDGAKYPTHRVVDHSLWSLDFLDVFFVTGKVSRILCRHCAELNKRIGEAIFHVTQLGTIG
jgi:hypothetical protein